MFAARESAHGCWIYKLNLQLLLFPVDLMRSQWFVAEGSILFVASLHLFLLGKVTCCCF